MNKKPAKAASVSSKCSVISRAILSAESLPEVVASMLAKKLEETFGTYKEERHPYQVTIAGMVGETLAAVEKDLQKAIDDAAAKKRCLETEHASVLAGSNDACVASEAAAKEAEDKKAALADSKKTLSEAKAAREAVQANLKKAEADLLSPSAKKETAERLTNEFLTPLKGGETPAGNFKKYVSDAKSIAKEGGLDERFTHYLPGTLSKASGWKTFDQIVVKEFEEQLTKITATWTAEIETAATAKAASTTELEAATAAVAAAEEAAKAADEAAKTASAAASEAGAAAKAAAVTAKPELAMIEKAAKACAAAEEELALFKSGALAAYTEVEALAKPVEPEPAPAPEAEVAAAPAAPPA
jgi:SWI/SNF-related matrix-associated actin-dependent regulator 1 of chromatin subfamily A